MFTGTAGFIGPDSLQALCKQKRRRKPFLCGFIITHFYERIEKYFAEGVMS